jgi:hypothetical protein
MYDSLYLPWPYAAKAIVEHLYNDSLQQLRVYITFRLPMNQTLKPANTKWLFLVDGYDATITSQNWLDAYTLLLIVNDITDPPSLVSLRYFGPGPTVYLRNDPARLTLETIWQKQWEKWAYMISHSLTA